jgi:hypothetical protein
MSRVPGSQEEHLGVGFDLKLRSSHLEGSGVLGLRALRKLTGEGWIIELS